MKNDIKYNKRIKNDFGQEDQEERDFDRKTIM